MSADKPELIDNEQAESERKLTIRLAKLQWWLNIVSGVLTAVGVGLYYADQRTLAQVCLLLITLNVLISMGLAYYRYKLNQRRRIELLTALEAERDTKLLEVFEEARRDRNLPPDKHDRNGFDASLKELNNPPANPGSRPGKKRNR